MFLLNIGYRWTNIERVDGVIINASGVHITQIERRNINIKPKVLLFDPQLYLSGLDSEHCNTTCARLSTYPWFGGSNLDPSSTVNRHFWAYRKSRIP